ncbi:DNA gyrase inhibitor YacG [Aquabacterium soli]|uniref:DNA gyrase inhibitor YacG n=1 Tax=Aquabacterium soli TaxID=2493092 RepID=A0A426VBM4_9BURK|nr:DNA gyrase inhibitor YacG [Aquabacterium soli]RRS04357.1 DNA gyrase inhibitor YacG [Aquabacterium soli]
MTTPKKTLMVPCPSCGEPHPYSTDNPYRPFCSKGCQAIDLGAWASEQYRMAAKPNPEDLPEDLIDPDDIR